MTVSLMGTSDDSIDDVCSLFTILIMCELPGSSLERGVQVKKIGAQIEIEYPVKGQGERNGLPHAGQGLAEVKVMGH